ncbi:MAG: protease modulator HflC [Chloroflexi bacterium]|nr:protease modulator HflC [Chloroflexota bacterium]
MKALIPILILLLGALFIGAQAAFIVDQAQYAIVTRFGEIQRVYTEPGLQFKTPFVEDVQRFNKRLLRIDVPTEAMQDRERQILEIDAYVRYVIQDPRKFLLTLRNEFNAESRIANIVVSEIRSEIARTERTNIIGGESVILADGTIAVSPKRTAEGVDVREALAQRVVGGANRAVQSVENDFGILIVDVRLKAADFPSSVEESVYNRMRTERSVQAQRLRAEGAEENQRITASVDREVTIIRAEAERTGNQLRGEGEAQAIAIFADALQQDPEFYAFQRSLQAYKVFLTNNTTVVLSADDELFKYLTSSALPTPTPEP